MFISITDLKMEETDDTTHILVMAIDSMGKPEEIKIFDKKRNFEYGVWIMLGY